MLLLDEPTTHLDLQRQPGLLNLVRDTGKPPEPGSADALHDLNLASIYADRVRCLWRGGYVLSGRLLRC